MKRLRTAGHRSLSSFGARLRVKSGDRVLFFLILILVAIGLVMVYDSSVAIALRDFKDPYRFLREQGKWVLLGLATFGILSRVSYTVWQRFAVPMMMGTLVLLLAVFIPGFGVRALGAHRWLNLGFTVLQPAEIAKFTLAMYLSTWLATKEKGRLPAFLLLLGVVCGLVILEPDLGTASIIGGIALSIYYLSGASIGQFLLLIPVIGIILGVLALTSPYRLQRVMTFLNPESDPLGSSYQIRQAIISLGSGGVFGVGLGKSRQKYEYLPEANTDSIFAILGEELGLIGGLSLIGVFAALVSRIFKIGKATANEQARLFVYGVGSWVGLQTLINLASMVALFPLTGVPLPLISYGGSNLVITLGALGIVHNISRSNHEI